MAFYSNVFIACTEQAYKKFESAYTAHKFAPTEIWRNSNNDYLLGWAWVKWYNEFDEVKSIHSVIDELKDNDCEENAFKFIMINEDNAFEIESNEFGDDMFEDTMPSTTLEFGTFENKNIDEVVDNIAKEYVIGNSPEVLVKTLKSAIKTAYEQGRKDGTQ